MSEAGLNGLFGAKSEVAEPSAPAATPEAPGPAPAAKEGEKESAPPAPAEAKPAAKEAAEPEEDDKHPVPRKALLEERRKRQEFERQLAELRGQLTVYQQQRQAPAEAVKSDPEADFYGKPVDFIRSEVGQVRAEVARMRLEVAEDVMRDAHPDYDEKIEVFKSAAQNNPALIQQLHASRNPARFAYDYAVAMDKIGDARSYEDLEARIRAKVEKELEAKYRKEHALAAADNASTSSAGARGSGATTPMPPKDWTVGLFKGAGV